MKRILVATDFSTRSDRAVLRAVLIARQSGADLTLLHVVDDDQPAYLIDAQRRAALEVLGQGARTIADMDGVATEEVVVTGDAFAGILRAAEEIEPDLVVVGPHRRQLLDAFVGTTAERSIRRSRRPVLMANGVPSGRYDRSLLAVDLDDVSRSALEAARRLGFLERTQPIALHLFDAPAAGMMKRGMEVPAAVDHYVDREEQRASTELHAFLSAAGMQHVKKLLKPAEGSPAGRILASADEQGVDLIVMGTNQRKGLKRFLLGSIAQEVLVDAKQDVLVVPLANGADEPAAQSESGCPRHGASNMASIRIGRTLTASPCMKPWR